MTQPNRPDAELRLWNDIEALHKRLTTDRLELGKLFLQLRHLYSERSAGLRLSSGPGSFEYEIKERGFKPNRVREWVNDYEVSAVYGRPMNPRQTSVRHAAAEPLHPPNIGAASLTGATTRMPFLERGKIRIGQRLQSSCHTPKRVPLFVQRQNDCIPITAAARKKCAN
jgi:hypothetical protein